MAPDRVHAIPSEDLESVRAEVPLLNVRGVCAYGGGQVVEVCIGWRGGMHPPNEEMHIGSLEPICLVTRGRKALTIDCGRGSMRW